MQLNTKNTKYRKVGNHWIKNDKNLFREKRGLEKQTSKYIAGFGTLYYYIMTHTQKFRKIKKSLNLYITESKKITSIHVKLQTMGKQQNQYH